MLRRLTILVFLVAAAALDVHAQAIAPPQGSTLRRCKSGGRHTSGNDGAARF